MDIDRLMKLPISDSLHRDNSELLIGTTTNFILICSKGKIRKFEYPVVEHYDRTRDWKNQDIYWHSDYLEKVIGLLKKMGSLN
jgi:hypothetical protein